MIRRADVAVLGGGFGGCLMALILKALGRSVVLLERGRHPRFAIGESSTPLANLLLADLARRYRLTWLLPFCKYGTWIEAYPAVNVGPKRGFSFFKHYPFREFSTNSDHACELLVAANPSRAQADTHWFREHFDHFLYQQVLAADVPAMDQAQICLRRDRGWQIQVRRGDEEHVWAADFVIDATGTGAALAETLGLRPQNDLLTAAWSVYGHFVEVVPWSEVLHSLGVDTSDYPFPSHEAALHHLLDEGWMWVLPFRNGITSAGVMFDCSRVGPQDADPRTTWEKTLGRYPSLRRQFCSAQAVRPLVQTGRLQRRIELASGAGWAMLPHTVYFVDPLFSTGIAHTLLCIHRLSQIFSECASLPPASALADYNYLLQQELCFVDRLVRLCYRAFGCFADFVAVAVIYFAGAIHSERAFGSDGRLAHGFLAAAHPCIHRALALAEAHIGSGCPIGGALLEKRTSAASLLTGVADAIAPINTAKLADPLRRNMYPY
ncbi:MAG: FAD-dependent oxidoreductase [Gemmataceae bacterium]